MRRVGDGRGAGLIARIKVLVLYQLPLVGEGLARMLEQDSRLEVLTASIDHEAEVDRALASDPAVIVVEDGGPIDPLELMRRSGCRTVIDVSAISSEAWAIHGRRVLVDQDRLPLSLVDACLDAGVLRPAAGHAGGT